MMVNGLAEVFQEPFGARDKGPLVLLIDSAPGERYSH